jgi:chromosome segregation ATPase
LLAYARNRVISAKAKAALEKVVEFKNTISDLQRRSASLTQQLAEISEEQTRIRENMKTLSQSSELYARYLKKFDAQETQVEGMREQLQKLRAEEQTQRKQLDDYISGLQLE